MTSHLHPGRAKVLYAVYIPCLLHLFTSEPLMAIITQLFCTSGPILLNVKKSSRFSREVLTLLYEAKQDAIIRQKTITPIWRHEFVFAGNKPLKPFKQVF
eukprot:6181166-Pleurochrysis_carterae.AAC.1